MRGARGGGSRGRRSRRVEGFRTGIYANTPGAGPGGRGGEGVEEVGALPATASELLGPYLPQL